MAAIKSGIKLYTLFTIVCALAIIVGAYEPDQSAVSREKRDEGAEGGAPSAEGGGEASPAAEAPAKTAEPTAEGGESGGGEDDSLFGRPKDPEKINRILKETYEALKALGYTV
ncbi:unnamed protein product [Medioppia subpectinata]|uniref:Uncharacterized protein n=1 Tax=Medioppia subpectinata TaxID=1979941 RepID=A0A7R9KN94_9ACAR|nr:unnamed protein product [Medioppia subpectinata]CAG2106392.1 unnamed protein product [Medioppia subpectinata]